MKKELKVIGWREWLSLPDLGIKEIKTKVHPEQDNSKKTISCKSQILEYRKVKSSNGQSELRPVILTTVKLLDEEWPIEITLTNRDEMGFRMLLGRASIKNKFLVNVGKSFYSKKINEKKRK